MYRYVRLLSVFLANYSFTEKAETRPAMADCPQCNYLRELAEVRGTDFDQAHCMVCVPIGPRPKMMSFYVICGVFLGLLIYMGLRPLSTSKADRFDLTEQPPPRAAFLTPIATR